MIILLNERVLILFVVVGMFLNRLGSMLDMTLEILSGSFGVANHLSVFLEVQLYVVEDGKFLVETDKQVLVVVELVLQKVRVVLISGSSGLDAFRGLH
jgi:hypothetical protein